jgi:hypothetical protein
VRGTTVAREQRKTHKKGICASKDETKQNAGKERVAAGLSSCLFVCLYVEMYYVVPEGMSETIPAWLPYTLSSCTTKAQIESKRREIGASLLIRLSFRLMACMMKRWPNIQIFYDIYFYR